MTLRFYFHFRTKEGTKVLSYVTNAIRVQYVSTKVLSYLLRTVSDYKKTELYPIRAKHVIYSKCEQYYVYSCTHIVGLHVHVLYYSTAFKP